MIPQMSLARISLTKRMIPQMSTIPISVFAMKSHAMKAMNNELIVNNSANVS
jgi:hypothetical protein